VRNSREIENLLALRFATYCAFGDALKRKTVFHHICEHGEESERRVFKTISRGLEMYESKKHWCLIYLVNRKGTGKN